MICDRCKKRIYGYLCDGCIHDQGKKELFEQMTNGDKIRSMTDKELAVTVMCPNEMGLADIPCEHSDNKDCYLCIRDWLQQPYREG